MNYLNRRKFLATTGLASVAAIGTCYGMAANGKSSLIKKNEDLLDLSNIPVFDHHTHEFLIEDMKSPEPWSFASMLYHGERNDGHSPEGSSGMSKALNYNISKTGVVMATIAELSQLFNCEDTLEAVTAERFRRISANAADYSKMLYNKAKIEAVLLDSNKDQDPPLMPCKVWRLVPNDKIFEECLESSDTLESFRKNYIDKIDKKLANKQYIAVKTHIAEQSSLLVEEIPLAEVQAAYGKARAKDAEAHRKVYVQAFNDLAIYCCEKGVPIHIHTGSTGGVTTTPLGQTCDPFLLSSFLKRPELKKLKVVLLHGGHPWTQHAALMAYNFPNVYLDMSWMFPWTVLGVKNYLHDAMSIAPLSKIFYGGGCHTGPETAYMGATVLKKTVSSVLSELEGQKFLTNRQANEVAHMILHKNVESLYNI